MNTLYYGDNLDILRRYIADESIDLTYLDPPFNSNADYNVLFAEHSGKRAAAQIKAFEDTWTWDAGSAASYEETVEQGGAISETMQAFRQMLGGSNMLAYLAMMAPRLVELHRVLKPTGSLYLHCDPTASHYLKITLDAIFGKENYRNEIVWKRRAGSSSAIHGSNRFGNVTDTIFYYAKSDLALFNPQYNMDDPTYQAYIDKYFTHVDENGRRFRDADLSNPAPRPNLMYEYNGVKPPKNGWAIGREKMEQWEREGKLYFTRAGGIRRKSYADELDGKPIQNLWVDIPPINSQAQERLGYPTQKPEALLHRIVSASASRGDTVLDPFCGCGTTISVAEQLGMAWIGIDVTHLSIGLIKHRMQDQFGPAIAKTYRVIGEPVSLPDAALLAAEEPFQFQAWALGLVGARKESSASKGADHGIDGTLYFHDDPKGTTKRIILSVKAGKNVSVAMVRDLVGTVTRESANIGVLLTMTPPTAPMVSEAASAGFYTSPMGGKHAKVQILTIAELLNGKGIDYPARSQRSDVTFRKARRIVSEVQALPFSALIPDDGEPE